MERTTGDGTTLRTTKIGHNRFRVEAWNPATNIQPQKFVPAHKKDQAMSEVLAEIAETAGYQARLVEEPPQ